MLLCWDAPTYSQRVPFADAALDVPGFGRVYQRLGLADANGGEHPERLASADPNAPLAVDEWRPGNNNLDYWIPAINRNPSWLIALQWIYSDEVQPILQAAEQVPNRRFRFVPELFLYGANGQDAWRGDRKDDAHLWIDRLISYGLFGSSVPCFTVADAPHFGELAYSACQPQPGLRAFQTYEALQECRTAGIGDFAVWGLGYATPASVAEWTAALRQVFYGT